MPIRHVPAILLALCLLPLGPIQARAAVSSPTSAVKAVLDKAMDIQTRPDMEGDSHRKERAGLVRILIKSSFAADEMAKETIKEHWSKLPAGQRSEFQTLFSDLFQESYTHMVLNFLQNENIEYRGEGDESGKGVLVKTVIMRSGEHIPVDYLVVKKGARWLIRDVVIDGVSIVDNYHDTFGRVIRTSSFDALLKKLRVQKQAEGMD